MKISNFIFLFGMFSFMAGCMTVEQSGREDVSQTMSERLGYEVTWENEALNQYKKEALADGRLTFDESVRLALINNHQLRAILEELGVVYSDVIKAGLFPNPLFDSEVSFVEGRKGEILEFGATQSLIEIILIPLRKQVATERYDRYKNGNS